MKKKITLTFLLVIGCIFVYFAYVGGAFLRLSPITCEQFAKSAHTLGYEKANADRNCISDETGITNVVTMKKTIEDRLHENTIGIPAEFYELRDESAASDFYNYLKEKFLQVATNDIGVTEVDKVFGNTDMYKNYSFNSVSIVLVRVGSTVLASKFFCNIESQKAIEQLLDSIGYNFNYNR